MTEHVIYENPAAPWKPSDLVQMNLPDRCTVRLSDSAYYVPENPHCDDAGRLPHDGGPMPEHVHGKLVQIKWRYGGTDSGTYNPEGFRWTHTGEIDDILAYRIVGSEGREAGDSSDFRTELMDLLNRWSKENGSGTPDFILRDYLCDCLKTFDRGVQKREQWYGRQTTEPATAMLDQEND